MDIYPVKQGEALPIQVNLEDDQGNPITTYAGTETLVATVWPGGNLPASFHPAASWISGPAGTIKVVHPAAQVAALAVGRYRGTLDLLDPVLGSLEAYRWAVDVLPAPGSEAPPRTYCGFPDLLDHAGGGGWLRTLQTPDTEHGYLRQRGRARSWLDDAIIAGWQTLNSLGPGDPGYGAILVGQGSGQLPSAWLRQQLDAGRLIVRDLVVEIEAKKALAFVCEGQVGPDDKGHQFMRLGRWYHSEAAQLLKTLRAELDTNGDGLAEFAVNLGCGSMRG